MYDEDLFFVYEFTLLCTLSASVKCLAVVIVEHSDSSETIQCVQESQGKCPSPTRTLIMKSVIIFHGSGFRHELGEIGALGFALITDYRGSSPWKRDQGLGCISSWETDLKELRIDRG